MADVDPIAVLRELSTFHRQGAEFCSNLNEALRHENWSEALDTLASQVEALVEATREIADTYPFTVAGEQANLNRALAPFPRKEQT